MEVCWSSRHAHHRFMLRELLDHLYFVESEMQRIEQEVAERLGPFHSSAWALSRMRSRGCAPFPE